ncbi:fimbrial protein [Acinetobacter guillouiae]|uniref:fimbrial protein n=1 Tax=Acinetobacter guillouiae TaxID=106649 RepID=UPI00124F8A75|nr:type 1 fimbrial protein [Acinetobacter guillouiae]
MKKLTLATLSTLAFTLACTNVFAVDGTITVNGVITDGTCTLQGSNYGVSGFKNVTINLPTMPKSMYQSATAALGLHLRNATGTGPCDTATSKAFKGIHLSVASPATNLDATDKTLLVNKATDASITNPVFIQFLAGTGSSPVDFSAPWGAQARSPVFIDRNSGTIYLVYDIAYVSKTGIVDAQNVNAKINYTMHYN